VKTLWIHEHYLQQILGGCKTVEVRVAYPNIARLQAGDGLLLNDQHRYRICRIATYSDFEALLAHEDPSAIAPGLPADQLLQALREIYPPAREALGAVALEIEPVLEEVTL
jgi:ASC-1-like (ASCH) protein